MDGSRRVEDGKNAVTNPLRLRTSGADRDRRHSAVGLCLRLFETGPGEGGVHLLGLHRRIPHLVEDAPLETGRERETRMTAEVPQR